MDSKDIDRAMRDRLPVVYDGRQYDRIADYIMWYDDSGNRRLSCGLIEKKQHENDTISHYDQFRFTKPQRMAEMMCNWIDCQKCPGRELCSHKEGKANGLVKWLEQEVSRHG